MYMKKTAALFLFLSLCLSGCLFSGTGSNSEVGTDTRTTSPEVTDDGGSGEEPVEIIDNVRIENGGQ